MWKGFAKGSAAREFLQGVIQVSACHLKRYLAHADGVERLRATSAEHLKAAERLVGIAPFMGLRVGAFLSAVDAYYSGLRGGDAGVSHDPAHYPYIGLEF